MPRKRNICFVTGTRAEFGLMRSTLRAIQSHRELALQLVVTGMHLHTEHGRSIDAIRGEGWKIDAIVPWRRGRDGPAGVAEQTGKAMSGLARVFAELDSDLILVVGDRVEAFAAASAGHLARRAVVHVHGGDRAQGQTDDSLRHAITKLSHFHFPATKRSAQRIRGLGEERWRIRQVGSPGIDGIVESAESGESLFRRFPMLEARRFALIVLHPVDATGRLERRRAENLLSAVLKSGIERSVVIFPNNDPGARDIIRCWNHRKDEITCLLKDVPRAVFLGLMRECAMLAGNSSSGIIEAASFGTPVVNVGPRQLGRERSGNVTDTSYRMTDILDAVRRIWNGGRPRRWRGRNVYGGGAATRIAGQLAEIPLGERLMNKLIAY